MLKTNLTQSQIESFSPAPWCLNGHIHTIGCSLFTTARKTPTKRIEIETPDSDFLEIDVIDHGPGNPAVALFHGLEGSTDRYYIQLMTYILNEQGYSVAGINFRSCGSRINRKRRFYHSGETDDYETVFSWMQNYFDAPAIGAVGFSLGGNALLKYLGENGKDNAVDASVAVSCPFDLKLGAKTIAKGFNRIYEYRFLRTLQKKLEEKRKWHTDLPRFQGSSLYEFDDQVTSKLHGFKDAEDYYKKCSADQFVTYLRKNTLIVHSKEDPICPVEALPMEEIRKNPFVDYIITERGGHVGYWGQPDNWLYKTIMNYFDTKLIY